MPGFGMDMEANPRRISFLFFPEPAPRAAGSRNRCQPWSARHGFAGGHVTRKVEG